MGYAALSLIGNNPYKEEELYTDRKVYPWNKDMMRDPQHGGWQEISSQTSREEMEIMYGV
jgi:hypothetical protein